MDFKIISKYAWQKEVKDMIAHDRLQLKATTKKISLHYDKMRWKEFGEGLIQYISYMKKNEGILERAIFNDLLDEPMVYYKTLGGSLGYYPGKPEDLKKKNGTFR